MCLASPLHWPRRNHFGPMSEIHGFTADLTMAVGPKHDFWSLHWNPVMGPSCATVPFRTLVLSNYTDPVFYRLDLESQPVSLARSDRSAEQNELTSFCWPALCIKTHTSRSQTMPTLPPIMQDLLPASTVLLLKNSNVCWLNKWKLVEKKTVCPWNHHLGLSKSQNKVSQVLKWGHPPFLGRSWSNILLP